MEICTFRVIASLANGFQCDVVVMKLSYLQLGVGPAGDLDDHVKDGLLLIGVEGDVVEGRDGDAILLDEDTVLEGVGLGDLADGVRHFGR